MIYLDKNKVDYSHFPDGTLLLKQYVQSDFSKPRDAKILWKFENNEELLVLFNLTRHLQSHGITDIHLEMPYIPNARQDRVKSDEDVFTLKYFSEMINLLGFKSVAVLDPHSNVSSALINNIVIKSPKEYILRAVRCIHDPHLLLFYPDEGAMKRYSEMINSPCAFGIKKRDWAAGKILGLDVSGSVHDIQGNNVLIVDDICSRGGTFYYSAKKLKEFGAARVYLYVSHCENTILEGDLLDGDLIDKVFTTNSIFTKSHEKMKVFNYEY